MENKIGKMMNHMGDKATDMFGKTKNVVKNAVDINGDGELTFEDVKEVASKIESVSKTATKKAQNKMQDMKLKSLNPFYVTDLNKTLPKLIQIVVRDKNYNEDSLCPDAIGYLTKNKSLLLLNIFDDSISKYDLSFYPNINNGFYYVDPSDEKLYIALDNYYDYLKVARISELQNLAQSLGAKHFKVSYKDKETKSTKDKTTVKGKNKNIGKMDLKKSQDVKSTTDVKIAAEMYFSGHEPHEPVLKYLKNDPSMNSLIKMRMATEGTFNKQSYEIQLIESSGINKQVSMEIDEFVSKFKCHLNVSMMKQFQKESKCSLIYEIEF